MQVSNTPLPSSIIETCLDVSDLERSRAFYSALFGYPILQSGDRFCAFRVGSAQVLILFLRGSDPEGSQLPFGFIPSHGANGKAHVGFRIPPESLGAWEARLGSFNIAVESKFAWPNGGTSIYFRDGDGHLLELLTPGVWTSDL